MVTGRAAILILLLSGSSAFASLEVRFTTGAALLVEGIELREGKATLTLVGGGTLTVDAARIASSTPVPTPEPAPAPPAARPSEPVMPPQTIPPPAAAPGPGESDRAAQAGTPPPPSAPGEGGKGVDYGALVRDAAARYQVDAELLRRVLEVESGFNPLALSPKGAMGVAQLMPGTARDLGVENPFDAAQGVDGAARLLRDLLAQSGGRFVPALAAYNAGPGAVKRYGGIPPYRETIDYVARVLSLYGTN